jgi:hypothetical protein
MKKDAQGNVPKRDVSVVNSFPDYRQTYNRVGRDAKLPCSMWLPVHGSRVQRIPMVCVVCNRSRGWG